MSQVPRVLPWRQASSVLTLCVLALANVLSGAVAAPQAVRAAHGLASTLAADACAEAATLISAIQGSGTTSPLVGQQHTVQGVVTGKDSALGGFYIQEEDTDVDADPNSSEGIFVFLGSAFDTLAADAVVGSTARVTATVGERSTTSSGVAVSQTQLSSVSAVVNCGAAAAPIEPAPVSFPLSAPGDFERYEGMHVVFVQELVISEFFNFDRFGELVLALPLPGFDRLVTPTDIVQPGAEAQALAAQYALRRITVDDRSSAQNPAVLPGPNGQPFSLSNRFRGGDTITGIAGFIDHSFGVYRLQPFDYGTYTAKNPRLDRPAVPGAITVVGFNTLNFFLTPDYPSGDARDNTCGPDQNMECRGADADQPNEFTRQRDKLLAALGALDADIVGLIELENTAGVSPLGDPTNGIVAGLNSALGAGSYDYIDTGVIGTDAIRVGLIYKPGTVTPVGPYKILNSSVDPRFIDTKNRPSLAQTFEVKATKSRFTVVVNHLKSKGSACDDVGDPDTGDGQGNCNQTRLKAAQALIDWVASDPTGSGDPDYLLLGDFNAYAKEDPIAAFEAAGYTNLIEGFQGPASYSYVFDGQVGSLDHALASPSLTPQVAGAATWHINADEPDVLDYDTSFKPDAQDALYEPNAFRSSDHDPVIVGLGARIRLPQVFTTGGVTQVPPGAVP